MIGLSWNCRGLGSSRTVRVLGDLLKDRKPAFLFLIETISFANKIEELRIKFGFDQCFSVDRVGRSGGLAIMWKSNVKCQITGYSQNHIDVVFSDNNVESWRLTCFYGFPERARIKDSWEFIRRLSNLSHLPWCIWGDFNDLLYVSDKEGNNAHPPRLLEGFRSAIEDCQLTELELRGGRFTWEKGRGTGEWVKERLDRAFATADWWSKFPLCNLQVFHTSCSDHDPLRLDLFHASVSKKEFRFRFENTWLKEPTFINEITTAWSDLPAIHLLPKLISISSYMARWGRTFFHKFREKVKFQKAVIAGLVDRVDEAGVKEYLLEKEKLNDLLLHEELFWKQRAKLFWLTEGDENTKFFHASASVRRRTNNITHLFDDHGEYVENNEGMCNIVRSYFTGVFAGEVNEVGDAQIDSPRTITDKQNAMLVKEVSFEEFTVAIKQMHPDKASGPDGLNPAFFQTFWSTLGHEVFSCCKDWLRMNSFPSELNNTNVVLIPKKENACSMKDLRPIALCNVLYKILAKVLANRLKTVLPTVISENQSAFVANRSITDNVLVAFEIIHHMKRKNSGSEGEVALKLDISKAYDRVSWTFLRQRMRAMGFCAKWVDWMMLCVKTVTYNFCLNGSYIGPIIPKRGLRQGDPLSPYLFLLCVEGLSNVLDQTATNGGINGYRISPSTPAISHLLFADDSFLFFKANMEEAAAVKSVLNNYERWSGQSVNYQKSGVFFSANVGQVQQLELCEVLGVHNGITNSNYLGLPSLVGRSKKRVFGFLKEKASKRIQGWQGKQISRAGKSILIRNVAQSIPSYCMSCFLLPKSLCQDLERMFNNYWWSSGTGGRKGINWLSWNNISMSKRKGGLGFRNLYGFNIALMGKHCWNFMQNPNSLVARVYKARYFPDSHPLRSVKGSDSSFIWSEIWSAKEALLTGFRWVVGDGNDIVAVKDPWLRKKIDFRVENSHFYEGRNEVISSFFYPNLKQWDVNRVQEQFLEEDAKAILAIPIPQCNIRDRVVWANSTNGIYSAKAGYHLWHAQNIGTSNILQGEGWGKIWRLLLPHKVKIFIWRFCRNTVPVRRRLSSKGVSVSWMCPMCNRDVEHLAHVFFDCEFAKLCWNTMGLSYDMSTVEYVPEWLLQKLANAPSDEVFKICVILWGIWFWRNKKVWENKSVSPDFAMEGSFRVVNEWKEAKRTQAITTRSCSYKAQKLVCKWTPPQEGSLKLNVDASVFQGSDTFSVGMIIRDHQGLFLAGRTIRLPAPASVFEAEVIGVKEALSWVEVKHLSNLEIQLETDSQLTEQAINRQTMNFLEVGDVVRDCCMKMKNMARISVRFIRKQANKAAHEIARYPCNANNHVDFTSPPSCLLETLLYDSLK